MKRLLRSVGRWGLRLVGVGVVLGIFALLVKDPIFKALAERRLRAQTGLEVSIRRFATGLLSPVLTIEDLKLYNTPEFGGSVFLSVPELFLEYDPVAAAQGRLHIRRARLNLAELNVVVNRAGHTNLLAILARAQPANAPSNSPIAVPTTPARFQFGGLDHLWLSLGVARVTHLDNPAENREFPIQWKNQEVKDLKTAEEVNNWATEVMLKVALQQFLKRPGKPDA